MRYLFAAALAGLLALPLSAASRPKGGFSLDIPNGSWDLTQGDDIVFTATVHRGDDFKQDVKLALRNEEGSKALSVVPQTVTIRAGNPNTTIHFIVRADLDAPLGKYKIDVTGVSASGEPITKTFWINVKAR